MKSLLTLTVVVLLGGITGPCASDDKQGPSFSSASPSPKALDDQGLPEIPYDEMLRKVAGLSKQAAIANLKDANLPHGYTEIRIWKGFGLTYPRCFVLSLTNGNPSASFVAPAVVGNKVVFRNGKPVYANTPLGWPHSGWDDFLDYLKRHGIGSSINLALDKRYVADPDSEVLVLEMKTGSRYTMAYYNDSTATVDGKKAFDVCKHIDYAWNFDLGCQ